jgi:hypothetical protein
MRVRAWEREQAWGPRYVSNELAGTRQAAAHHHQTAVLRHAEADAATEAADRARLQEEAAQAAALAATLDERAAQLQQLDDARAVWLAHTAGTRAEAEEARALLAERHADDAEPEPVVTAEEWLAAHHAAVTEDEQHREIVADDVAADGADERHPAAANAGAAAAPVDIRDVATTEPRQTDEDIVRVAPDDTVVDACRQARRSLAEIAAREEADQHAEDHERGAELARWHDEDQAVDEHDTTDEHVLEVDPSGIGQ